MRSHQMLEYNTLKGPCYLVPIDCEDGQGSHSSCLFILQSLVLSSMRNKSAHRGGHCIMVSRVQQGDWCTGQIPCMNQVVLV